MKCKICLFLIRDNIKIFSMFIGLDQTCIFLGKFEMSIYDIKYVKHEFLCEILIHADI